MQRIRARCGWILAASLCASLVEAHTVLPREPHVIQIRGFFFVPKDLEVAPGDTVVWVNRDLVPHTVTAENGAWESGTLDAGDSWQLVVDDPAMLPGPYYCRHHPGMRGALVAKQNHISIPKADRLSAEINHAGEST